MSSTQPSVFVPAYQPFRYRHVTCFEFSFVGQICIYKFTVNFIISERGGKELNITVTKNLFHKELGPLRYDRMLLGDPLKQREPFSHRHSEISIKLESWATLQ
jgi:hypothetical protein